MEREEIEAEYAVLIAEQQVLRNRLFQVNLRKMLVSCDITRMAHGKPPSGFRLPGESDADVIKRWREHHRCGMRASRVA